MLQGLINNGNGTLNDKQTGLMWQLDDDGIQRSYEEATGYCQALELAGHNDWRLPNKEELLTLAAYDFDTLKQAFPQIKSERYWAHTTIDELYWAEAPDRIAYTIDFDPNSGNYKQAITYFKSYSYYVRAVRNTSQDESKGCVTEQKTCSNCDGLGKTIYSIHLHTGPKKYKSCEACDGSRVICGSEKAYYSVYPDVSLRNAQELIIKLGNPAQIDILSDEVNLHFADGSKFILGGFTVGYRGTGPDFTHRLLQACDFNVSMDEIASMKPPLTLQATKQARETKKADTYYQIDYENGTIPIGDLPMGETRGNSVGNLVNGGLAAQQGGWIYYRSNDGGKIYKTNPDGGESIKINDDNSYEINVIGDWIYYRNAGDRNKIYKIGIDGSGQEKVIDDLVNEPSVVGDWIYYNNYGDDGKIYKVRTDGSGREKVNNENSSYLNVFSDWIYYSSGYKICKIRTDGSEHGIIISDTAFFINLISEWIYYRNVYNEGKIYKIHIDGSGHEKVNDDSPLTLNVVDNWIYYSNENYGGRIYKVRTDGTNREKLNNDRSWSLNVIGDWIYYSNEDDGWGIYMIRTDGRDRYKV